MWASRLERLVRTDDANLVSPKRGDFAIHPAGEQAVPNGRFHLHGLAVQDDLSCRYDLPIALLGLGRSGSPAACGRLQQSAGTPPRRGHRELPLHRSEISSSTSFALRRQTVSMSLRRSPFARSSSSSCMAASSVSFASTSSMTSTSRSRSVISTGIHSDQGSRSTPGSHGACTVKRSTRAPRELSSISATLPHSERSRQYASQRRNGDPAARIAQGDRFDVVRKTRWLRLFPHRRRSEESPDDRWDPTRAR